MRRSIRLPLLLLVAAVATVTAPAAPARAAFSPIAFENAQRGDTDWKSQLAPPPAIEGYSTQVSVSPDEPLAFHVSTRPAARYRIEIVRLGWYGGTGGRLLRCLPACGVDRMGVEQPWPPPPDPETGELRAGWQVTDELVVPPDYPSGYYVAKLLLTSGPDAGKSRRIPFIVRSPSHRRTPIAVVVPVSTWQAYNNWGGKNLYFGSSTDRVPATHVSFDRPFTGRDVIFSYEYQLIRFLERQGYDISYVTDVDVHRNPWSLAAHRLVITAGHGEYWSKEERDAFEYARGRGTNLIFMGANTGYWQARYENRERTLVAYKGFPDPIPYVGLETTKFRLLGAPRPECQLLGVQYNRGIGATLRPYRVMAAATPFRWMRGTNLRRGSLIKVVGGEWDHAYHRCRRTTTLFHHSGERTADAVTYRYRSGARVFSSGSLNFAWGLDDFASPGFIYAGEQADARLQRFVCNMIADFARSPEQRLRFPVPCRVIGSLTGLVPAKPAPEHGTPPPGLPDQSADDRRQRR